MSDSFKEFVEAEVCEILNSMDEKCRRNPELNRISAIEWIEKNAENFRKEWNLKKKLNIPDVNN